ncbi:PepSY-like domain-containing protein [Arachidicoccus soli]|uniref:Uncharacterized protein n=1 Tax=Arachidicoccus soli TaxID=2341117 RepID=A0A386HKS0_9BACT|nr:PepSY-like domain-containing protein [Arachidicoccus soli]AYD46323.1 hypothetical protein D6B99_01010 [Arachidicoccus soli]
MKFLLTGLLSICLSFSMANAQIRNVPTEVKSTIHLQFPNAKHIDYSDYLAYYQVKFINNDSATTVIITNKGKIKATSVSMKYDDLPSAVKDGFKKSKYADWKVKDVARYYQPDQPMQYEINASGESFLSKKNLFFSRDGQLLSDKQVL